MSHDIKLLTSHNFTELCRCVVFQPLENTEFVPKLAVTLTYK